MMMLFQSFPTPSSTLLWWLLMIHFLAIIHPCSFLEYYMPRTHGFTSLPKFQVKSRIFFATPSLPMHRNMPPPPPKSNGTSRPAAAQPGATAVDVGLMCGRVLDLDWRLFNLERFMVHHMADHHGVDGHAWATEGIAPGEGSGGKQSFGVPCHQGP